MDESAFTQLPNSQPRAALRQSVCLEAATLGHDDDWSILVQMVDLVLAMK